MVEASEDVWRRVAEDPSEEAGLQADGDYDDYDLEKATRWLNPGRADPRPPCTTVVGWTVREGADFATAATELELDMVGWGRPVDQRTGLPMNREQAQLGRRTELEDATARSSRDAGPTARSSRDAGSRGHRRRASSGSCSHSRPR